MTPGTDQPSPDLRTLADRAALLRRSALQTRLRLVEQSRELERLAGRLSAARDAAPPLAVRSSTPPVGALDLRPEATTARAAAPQPVSVRKEAVAVSAPVPASLRAEARRHAAAVAYAVLPFAVIAAAAYAAHVEMSPYLRVLEAPASAAAFVPARDALAVIEPPAPSADAEESAEALLLVHEWRPAGEEATVLETLGGALDRPGRPPLWSVERAGARQYLVRFRDGATEHVFEADLDTRVVRTAAVEADSLLANR